MIRFILFLFLTFTTVFFIGCASTQQRSLSDDLNDLKGQNIEAVKNYRRPMDTAYDPNTGDHYVWREIERENGKPGTYYFAWRIRPVDIGHKDVDYVEVSTDSGGKVVDFNFLDELPWGKAK